MEQEIIDWIEDGNAVEIREGVWKEQTTQWRKEFTTKELIDFFHREFGTTDKLVSEGTVI